MDEMRIRGYQQEDCPILVELFYHTVHTVNAKDYSQEQLNAWANDSIDIPVWNRSFLQNYTLVVEVAGTVVGFGDMDAKGYLDRLYVHKDYQNQGIATALVTALEYQGNSQGIFRFHTYASVTAKPFFISRGYKIMEENLVVRDGVEIPNFLMEKG